MEEKAIELQDTGNQIDIYHAIQIPNLADFPVEDFFKVPYILMWSDYPTF